MSVPVRPPRGPWPRLTQRGRVLLGVAATVLIVLAVVVAVVGTTGGGTSTAKPTPSQRPPVNTTTSAAPSVGLDHDAEVAAAAAATRHILSTAPGGGAFVAAANTATGARFVEGNTSGNWTASCYKLLLLETLLLQHQQQGTDLDGDEISDATTAIENSDNVAGYQLWLDIGSNPGMQASFPTLGLTHAVANGTDPTFTRITPTDALAVLNNLVSPKSPLDAQSRSFALNLMRNVETDQRWGAGVIADPGTDFANKNGWLSIDDDNAPGEDDNGLWVVNSFGVLTVGGDQVLLAVFSEHNPSFQSGVALIERLARAVRPVVSG